MNAPAAYRPPRREDYEPNVRAFLPGVDGEELELRSRLLFMRDCAVATKPAACEEAWALLDLVERTASRDAFRSMPLDELRELRRLLVMCVAAASDFDALFAPELPMEEAVARG